MNLEDVQLSHQEMHKICPSNWIETRLSEIVKINPTKPKLSFQDNHKTSFISMSAVDPISGKVTSTEQREFSKVKKGYTYFQEGDILFAKITPCMENGNIVITGGLLNGFGFGSTEFFVLRPSKLIDKRYIYYLLRSEKFRKEAKTVMSGAVGQQRVPKTFIENYILFLPPLNEQKRIADKIESLFAKIDEAKRLIDEAKESFELRRAAILDKAFRGELTREWRDNNTVDINFKQLYQNIKKERLKLNIKSKDSKIAFDIPNTQLPENWAWTTLNKITLDFKNGLYKSAEFYSEKGTPCLRMYNIDKNELNFSNMHYMNLTSTEIEEYGLKYGDILINRVNSKELVGKCASVPNDFPTSVFESKNIRIRLSNEINPDYISMILSLPYVKELIYKSTKQTVGMATISQEFLRSIPVPLPSREEQDEIINIIKSLLKKEKEIITHLDLSIEPLKQSILQKAFRGELGTNDPTEESAFELLKETLQAQLK